MTLKKLDEWDFAIRVREELKNKDSTTFKILKGTGRIFPFKGTFQDEEGNLYEILEDADIEQMSESLLKDLNVTIQLEFDAKEVIIKQKNSSHENPA